MLNRNATTLVDRPCWVLVIPKPRLPLVSRRAIRYAAMLALSVGFNVGFVTDALASEECEASAVLHYEISGGSDAAYENALAACERDIPYTQWMSEDPSECELIAERSGPAAYEATYAACVAMGVDMVEAYNAAGECETPTGWAENLGYGLWRPVCGDADGNEVGAP